MIFQVAGPIVSPSPGKHVVITSNEPTPSPGDWNDINCDGEMNITYLDMMYFDFFDPYPTSLNISDSTFSNFSFSGLYLGGSFPATISYTVIDGNNIDGTCLRFSPVINVTYSINHCTFKNNNYGVSVNNHATINVNYCNFMNINYDNILASASNTKSHDISNNYWNYDLDDVTGTTFKEKLKIDTDLTGTITWSPYEITEILDAYPRP